MPTLDSIVSVQISKTSVAVSQQGFGIPLILGYHTRFPEDVRSYSSIAAMVADGFATTDLEYKAASAAFAQNPSPTAVVIGRRAVAPTQVIELTPTAVANAKYTVGLNGQEVSFTAGASPTVAQVVTGIQQAIANASPAFTGLLTATDNTTKVTITGAAGKGFTYYGFATNGAQVNFQDVTTDAGVAADLTRILAASKQWYGVVLTQQGKAEVVAAAAWIEANKRLMIVATNDADVKSASTSDMATALKNAAYLRTAVIWAPRTGDYAAAAWFGNMLPRIVGSADFIYKSLAGVTAGVLTDTEIGNLTTKRANWYIEQNAVNITNPGSVASGEWLDVVLGLDWLTARLQERIFARLAGLPKIPFTDNGIGLIVSEVLAQLQEGVENGLLANGYTCTAPRAKNVSTTNKQNRILPDVKFQATLAGSVHIVQIVGTISV